MTTFFRKLCQAGCAFTLAAAGAGAAMAQPDYPTQAVRAVLPYSAGSGPDAVTRHVGELLGRDWGQQVVVYNRPGANGWLAIGDVKRAKPDGHTLLVLDSTYMGLQPNLYKDLPFDPVGDFDPVAALYTVAFFVVVRADSPWQSVSDLLAAAKAKPGSVSYGTWGLGSVAHVGTAQLEAATGVQMMHVPFKELPQLYTAVATGEVDWAFGTAATVDPLYRAGKVRLLAYAAPQRLAGYESVPTVAESGGPGDLDVATWVAVFAPKGTPAGAVERIQASVDQALATDAVRERMAGYGFEPWSAGPQELASTLAADTKRYADVVSKANIALD